MPLAVLVTKKMPVFFLMNQTDCAVSVIPAALSVQNQQKTAHCVHKALIYRRCQMSGCQPAVNAKRKDGSWKLKPMETRYASGVNLSARAVRIPQAA
jgi:hypothetical protein